MGKRSRQRMTGLSKDQRIKKSVKQKAEEEERRRNWLAKVPLGTPVLPEEMEEKKEWKLPPPGSVFISPIMHKLLEIEREREREKR